MKTDGWRLLGQAMCDIIEAIGELSIAGQNIVEQSPVLNGLTE
jgi:hypothetical protein